jgi:hypothetical protein
MLNPLHMMYIDLILPVERASAPMKPYWGESGESPSLEGPDALASPSAFLEPVLQLKGGPCCHFFGACRRSHARPSVPSELSTSANTSSGEPETSHPRPGYQSLGSTSCLTTSPCWVHGRCLCLSRMRPPTSALPTWCLTPKMSLIADTHHSLERGERPRASLRVLPPSLLPAFTH